MPASRSARPGFEGSILKATLIVAATAVILLLLWQLSTVLLLVFAAILVAVLFRSVAGPIERHTPLNQWWALVAAIALIILLLLGFLFLLGTQIALQLRELVEQLPGLLDAVGDRLGIADLGQSVTERLGSLLADGETVLNVAGMTMSVFGAMASLVLVVIAGIYISMQPRTYRSGFLALWPPRIRGSIAAALDGSGNALGRWILGQLAAMAIVGVLSTAGLMLLGVPSALALGFIAAVADFVPIVGPIVGAVPAVLVAFSVSPLTALWVIGLYVVIQQLDGDVIQPLIHRRGVRLPPALMLFALVSFGVLFGPLGLVLATPITVVLMVWVKQLYIRDTLGEDTDIAGEDAGS